MTATPPYSQAAEEALLGAVLIDPSAYDAAAQFLTPPDFYLARHQWIWEAIGSLRAENGPIDFLTVAKRVEDAGRLKELGGPAYLTGLINQTPTSLHAEAYAREVKENAVRRAMLGIGNALAQAAFSLTSQTDRALMDSRDDLERLLAHGASAKVETLAPVLSAVYDKIKERAENPCNVWGIPVGLPKLDNETGGQQAGELTLLAGEPGLGKTWLAIGAGLHMARFAPGAFFSLEMGKEAITRRILSAWSEIRARNLRTGHITVENWENIMSAIDVLAKLPFYLDDRTRDTGGLRAALFRLKREADIRWFILDYLMLLEDDGRDETEKTANISRALKHICRDLDIAGLVIHSTNKSGMDRGGSEASKSSLRGSGQVIYDADLILFLTEYQASDLGWVTPEEKARMATLWVKKGRELEDPRIHLNLVRQNNSPLWGELEKR